jgi:hypothetical protein
MLQPPTSSHLRKFRSNVKEIRQIVRTDGCKEALLKLETVDGKEKMMKVLRIGGISWLLVFWVGMAVGQDAAHGVDKVATKTGHVAKHATKKVGNATKTGAEDVGHGTKVAVKDTRKGVKTGVEKTGDGVKDVVTK